MGDNRNTEQGRFLVNGIVLLHMTSGTVYFICVVSFYQFDFV